MNIDIRTSIINNFKNSNIEEIKESINQSIKDKDEITLPGLGVFFELLWNEEKNKEHIVNLIKNGIKKSLNN